MPEIVANIPDYISSSAWLLSLITPVLNLQENSYPHSEAEKRVN